jgi:DNA-binding transcriptional LysR family regulator
MEPGTPTLDQLRLFLTIVETGSFAGAGRRLNRATSVISYGIANLEAQLGVSLFDREGTRKPRLTIAGEAVLAEARTVANGVDGLRAKVRGLLQGLEAELGLAVDVLVPMHRVGNLLRAFQIAFPTVSLRLYVEALGAVPQLVIDGRAAIGVSGPLAAEVGGLERIAVGAVSLIPVAAPSHPLARMDPIPPGAVRDHIQLVLTDRSKVTEGRDFSVLSPRSWRLADLGSKLALLREGVGWGNMPALMVEGDIQTGRLVRLDLPDHRGGIYRFDAIYRRDAPPGPAASWLLEQLVAQSSERANRADI